MATGTLNSGMDVGGAVVPAIPTRRPQAAAVRSSIQARNSAATSARSGSVARWPFFASAPGSTITGGSLSRSTSATVSAASSPRRSPVVTSTA
ncbi:MAG: hypothetical protein LW698_03855 [Planctomycetaceae bacterium]|nr:hypothetical protein [Planctomycetaceae bacterium]